MNFNLHEWIPCMLALVVVARALIANRKRADKALDEERMRKARRLITRTFAPVDPRPKQGWRGR